jgi:hypothetical protein
MSATSSNKPSKGKNPIENPNVTYQGVNCKGNSYSKYVSGGYRYANNDAAGKTSSHYYNNGKGHAFYRKNNPEGYSFHENQNQGTRTYGEKPSKSKLSQKAERGGSGKESSKAQKAPKSHHDDFDDSYDDGHYDRDQAIPQVFCGFMTVTFLDSDE